MKSKFITIQTSNSLVPSQRMVEYLSALDITFLTVISFAIILSFFVPICDLIVKRKQQSRAHSPKLRTDPICPSCQYFSNNCYLRCALQPTIAMTEESIDCRDYSPISSKKN